MRVLHFFKTYHPDTFGGIERAIHALAKGGVVHGIHADVLSLSRDPVAGSGPFDGHMTYKAKLDLEFASTGFSREAIRRFAALTETADIVHYHFPWPFMDLVHMLRPPGKPCVVSYHSDIVKQKSLLRLYTPLMHRFLSSVDRIVATSDNYVATSPVLQRYREKVDAIPLGLDELDYPKADDELRGLWRTRFPRPFFLFVGVLRYYKGVHVLLEACENLPADVVIVGEGPMDGQLRRAAKKRCLDNVHFLGHRSDAEKAALLELCTAFVFPSHLRSEAFGLSLVEAAMFGKPMISCEIGTATSFVNQHGRTGLVVEPNDPAALRSAMQTMLHNPDMVMEFSRNARKHFEEQLTGSRMVASFAGLYADLMERRRERRPS